MSFAVLEQQGPIVLQLQTPLCLMQKNWYGKRSKQLIVWCSPYQGLDTPWSMLGSTWSFMVASILNLRNVLVMFRFLILRPGHGSCHLRSMAQCHKHGVATQRLHCHTTVCSFMVDLVMGESLRMLTFSML